MYKCTKFLLQYTYKNPVTTYSSFIAYFYATNKKG